MTDAKTTFRALLIGSTPLTTLVPATRITQSWPTASAVFPLIVFSELDNSTDSTDYFDNQPTSETSSIQVDVFCAPGTSSTTIAQAVDNAVVPAFWNRDYSGDFVEPDTKLIHRVIRYHNRLDI